jgi:hypothetical protein
MLIACLKNPASVKLKDAQRCLKNQPRSSGKISAGFSFRFAELLSNHSVFRQVRLSINQLAKQGNTMPKLCQHYEVSQAASGAF